MKHLIFFTFACLLLAPATVHADDLKLEDLLGKWELVEGTDKLPKGTLFDFQKNGKLAITLDRNGEKKTAVFAYELKTKEKRLAFIINDKSDSTAVVTLNAAEMVFQDKDGLTPKFKRVK